MFRRACWLSLVSCGLGATATVACSSDEPVRSFEGDGKVRENADGGGVPGSRDGSSPSKNDARIRPTDEDAGEQEPSQRDPVVIDECKDGGPAGLTEAEIEKLKAGSAANGMRFLYPYENTVFPRGLGAPLVMWDGGPGRAVYVHISADAYEYTGCVRADDAGRIQLSKAAWDTAEQQTLGRTTPFTVEVTTLDGTTVHGPIKEKLIISRGSLKGSIFYNTYNGGLQGAANAALAGFVERIKPGQQAEFFTRSGSCTGCHAISANGERMVTREVLGINPGYVFSLKPDSPPNPAPMRTAANTSFVGLSPDGSVYLTTAAGFDVGPAIEGALPVIPQSSVLIDTDSGNPVANSGFPTTALMPTFSPDGKLAVFNDQAKGGRNISLVDYDASARRASNAREVYSARSGGFPGWPFVLPDNAGVVFTLTDSPAFTGGGAFILPTLLFGPRSDLMMVDSATGDSVLLAKAMGFNSADDAKNDAATYLPFGPSELHQNYYPTVSPVASGGYFWVFFDSIRHYGNMGVRRQLWGTAIEVQGRREGKVVDLSQSLYGSDHSSPAFYVSGQVFDTANHRAFTALDPCLSDGASCNTGVDCCTGFCTDGVCGPPKSCAGEDEACKVAGDCCDKAHQCINGFCGVTFL